MTEDRDIAGYDSGRLHQACGIGEYEPLPKGLEDKYWELKRIHDRLGAPLTDAALTLLVFLHGHGRATDKEKAPPTIVDLWRNKKVKAGDTLIATWRKEDHEATLLGINARTKGVQLQFSDGEERELPADQVRVPELAGV